MERLANKSFEGARSLPVEVDIQAVSAFVHTLPSTVPTSWSWFNFNSILMIIGTTALISTLSFFTLTTETAASGIQPAEISTFEIKAPVMVMAVADEPLIIDWLEELPVHEGSALETFFIHDEDQNDHSLIASLNDLEIPEIDMEVPDVESPRVPSDSIFVEINAGMTDDEIRSQIQFAKEYGVCLCRCNWRRFFGGKVRKINMNVKANNECFQRLEVKGFETIRFDWKLVGDEVVEFHKRVNGGERAEVSISPGTHTRGIYKYD